MEADEIIAVAAELNCGPSESAVAFARMVAEHCAQLAQETHDAGSDPAAAIRQAFRLAG